MVTKAFYAGGFLFNPDNRSVLIHLRDDKTPVHPNQWGLFGGMNEGSESPAECFTRELHEELGLSVEKDLVVPLRDYFNEARGTWRYVFYVKSNIEKTKLHLTEGADFDWVPLDKVFSLDLTEKTRSDIEFFLKSTYKE